MIKTKAMTAMIKYIQSGLNLGVIAASTEHNERRRIQLFLSIVELNVGKLLGTFLQRQIYWAKYMI
jgi:hypothetical protein